MSDPLPSNVSDDSPFNNESEGKPDMRSCYSLSQFGRYFEYLIKLTTKDN